MDRLLLWDMSGLYTLFVAHVYLDTWSHLTGASANWWKSWKTRGRK